MRALVIAAVTVLGLGLSVAPAAAGHLPPGQAIQGACNASFGQLIGSAKSGGDAAHGNYAGGAKAFVALLEAHGCTADG